MKKTVKILILSLLLAISAWGGTTATAQTRISGTVRDTKGEPVIGAVVMLEGSTSVAATTDFEGRYTLTLPVSVRQPRLKTACIGYL